VDRPHWYEQLLLNRQQIEQQFGAELDWNVKEGRRQRYITSRTTLDPTDSANWPECVEWHLETLTKMRAIFQPYVHELV
jgi:hypothetical protein